jgi:hypothetical protein
MIEKFFLDDLLDILVIFLGFRDNLKILLVYRLFYGLFESLRIFWLLKSFWYIYFWKNFYNIFKHKRISQFLQRIFWLTKNIFDLSKHLQYNRKGLK